MANHRLSWIVGALIVAAGTGLGGYLILHDPGPSDKGANPNEASLPDLYEDVTAQTGIDFTYRNGQEAGHLAILESLGGGVGLIDYNGDGLLDVFLTGGGYFAGKDNKEIKGHPCKLYQNLGNFKFKDVTAASIAAAAWRSATSGRLSTLLCPPAAVGLVSVLQVVRRYLETLMQRTERHLRQRRARVWRRRLLFECLLALLVFSANASRPAPARAGEPPSLVVAGVNPGGIRLFTTESWGTFDVHLTNRTDTDRQARVLVFYQGQPDVQYGRDLWLPAHATLSTWMLVGPAAKQPSDFVRDLQFLFYDRTGGKDRLLVEATEERVRARGVLYRKREPFTALLLDEQVEEKTVFGELPKPLTRADEATDLARTFRSACDLSDHLAIVTARSLPPLAEGFDGIEHFILASERIGHDPAGMQALRQWLERGGRLWVLLDMVAPRVVAPLLGGALDFEVVDRVRLTSFKIDVQAGGAERLQQHERPVDFVRVLLPDSERSEQTINGWPVWFTRPVGRGKVLFTTLGPRGWVRARQAGDPRSPYPNYPTLPMSTAPLQQIADELHVRPLESAFRIDDFRPLLGDEIGYEVISRASVAMVMAAFLVAALALALFVRKSRRAELLGWLGPTAAVGAAAVLFGLGESSRRGAQPTVAVAQVVDAVSGTEEAAVHGLLAVYRPDSGATKIGAGGGGLFELDMAGLEGHSRRFLLTDRDAWHWEPLALPAGVRFAAFHYTVSTKEPLGAVARFGPEGIEGRISAGPFLELSDALLSTPSDRTLGLRLQPDGTVTSGS